MFRALFIFDLQLIIFFDTSRTRMGCRRRALRAHPPAIPSLGVVMRDHNTNYSKGSTEPARMMTPFLASNVFGSIESNSITNFCPSLNVQGQSLVACSTVWTLRG